MNKIAFTDKSVRDNTQRAVILDDKIILTNRVMGRIVKKTEIPLEKWQELERSFGNPSYNKREYIRSLDTVRIGDRAEDYCLKERIIDAQISAINKVFIEWMAAKKKLAFDK
jgi:hypothetical protein